MNIGFATVANGPFLAQAVLMARSVRAQHPGSAIALIWAEQNIAPPDWLAEEFSVVVRSHELGYEGIADMAYRYDLLQLCCAHKALALRWLLSSQGVDLAIFLDSDIRLFAPLSQAIEAAKGGADIILTPHFCEPVRGEHMVNETALMLSGTYNTGFIAVSNTESGRRFVDWYVRILSDKCLIDAEQGLYVDQKWLEMAASFVDQVVVIRDPGYNVAYWNAHQRPLVRKSGRWQVAGVPLVFFHLSQFAHFGKDISAYFSAYFHGAGSSYRDLLNVCSRELASIKAQHSPVLASPCEAPATCVRLAYAASAPILLGDADAVALFAVDWLNEPHPAWEPTGPYFVTRLYDHIWRRRPDIRNNKFDIDRFDGRRDYVRWLVETGCHEEGIPEEFLVPARNMLALDVEVTGTVAPEIGATAQDLSSLQAENEGYRAQVEILRAERDEALAGLSAESASHQSEVALLASAINAHQDQIAALSNLCVARESELASLTAESDSRQREITHLTSVIKAYQSQIALLSSICEMRASELASLSAECVSHQSEVTRLNTVIEAHQSQIASLSSLCEGRGSELARLAIAQEDLARDFAASRLEQDAVIAQLTRQDDEKGRYIDVLSTALVERTSEAATLSAAFREVKSAVAAEENILNNSLAEARREIARLAQELSVLRGNVRKPRWRLR